MTSPEILKLKSRLAAARRWGWDETRVSEIRRQLAVALAAERAADAASDLIQQVADWRPLRSDEREKLAMLLSAEGAGDAA